MDTISSGALCAHELLRAAPLATDCGWKPPSSPTSEDLRKKRQPLIEHCVGEAMAWCKRRGGVTHGSFLRGVSCAHVGSAKR